MQNSSSVHNPPIISIAVSSTEGNPMLQEKAADLARTLQLRTVPLTEQEKYNALLVYTENGLQIQLKQDMLASKPVTLHVDFLSDALTYRLQHGGGIKQALARAIGIKPGIRPSIIDATAGLGKDSFILASLGCKVIMIERSPLLAALLQDGWERALLSQELKADIKERLTLLQSDAITIIKECTSTEEVDTIYLDPMYPHSNKSALNRIEMRIIRELVGDDIDAAILLETALSHATKRVVVKRPKGAPLLNERLPTHTIKMKNSRFDVYML